MMHESFAARTPFELAPQLVSPLLGSAFEPEDHPDEKTVNGLGLEYGSGPWRLYFDQNAQMMMALTCLPVLRFEVTPKRIISTS